jgi:hypothetical protein
VLRPYNLVLAPGQARTRTSALQPAGRPALASGNYRITRFQSRGGLFACWRLRLDLLAKRLDSRERTQEVATGRFVLAQQAEQQVFSIEGW